MKNTNRTKEQLLGQIRALQKKITSLEKTAAAQKQTEDALSASEKNLSAILEKNADGIVIVDTDDTVLYVNPAAEKLFDKQKADFLGYPFGFPVSADKAEESLIIRKGDTFCEAELRVVEVYWGKRRAFLLSVRDSTERKQAEEALHTSEEKYRNILENIEEGYYEIDLAGNFTFVNDAISRHLGYTKEELIGMSNLQYTDKKNANKALEIFNEIYRTGESGKVFDYELIRKDGTKMQAEVSASLIKDSLGKAIGFRGVSRDNTERKKTEEAIRQSEERYRTILENVQEGYYEIDLAGNFIFLTEGAYKHLGYTKEEMIGTKGKRYQDETTAKKLFQLFNNLYRTGEPILATEGVWIRKDGTKGTYEMSGALIKDAKGKPIGFRGVSRDITERKRSEQALRESEEKYRAIVENATDQIFVLNKEKKYVSVNKTVEHILGKPADEIIGKFIHELLSKETADRFSHNIDEVFITGENKILEEEMTAGREKLWISTQLSPIKDKAGEVYTVMGIVRDITERKRAEDKLREYGEELLALSEASNSVIGIMGTENLFRTICDNAMKLFKVKFVWLGLVRQGSFAVTPVAHAGTDDDYVSTIRVTWDDSPFGNGPAGMSIKKKIPHMLKVNDPLFAPWAQEAKKRGFGSVLAVPLFHSGKDCIGVLVLCSGELDFFTVDVIRLCQIFANQAASAIENAQLVEGLEEKIQERTRQFEDANLELQTVNQELEMRRMEAEGAKIIAMSADRAKSDFLANMSHELRTPLNAILGFSEMMMKGMAGALVPKQVEYLKDINESGAFLLSLINDILDLSKVEAGKMELEYKEIDARDVIDRVLVLFKEKTMRHGIQMAVEIEEGIGAVPADERKIKQVLLNLLSNAVKFTTDGGTVRVTVRKVRSSEFGVQSDKEIKVSELLTQHSEPDRDFMEISVANTGPSIKAEDIPKLFKPFQQLDSSYEKKHQGTGLGLALCKRIVELHHGKIWVTSEVGRETTFTFIIPVKPPENSRPNNMNA